MGLTVQIGHDGQLCPCPRPAPGTQPDGFTVVDMSGIHQIRLLLCGCPLAPLTRLQLLQAALFPATLERPQTAFTFDLLNTFHLLNLQGKTSMHDFYYAIHFKTDNAGIENIKVILTILSLRLRQLTNIGTGQI